VEHSTFVIVSGTQWSEAICPYMQFLHSDIPHPTSSIQHPTCSIHQFMLVKKATKETEIDDG